MKAIRIIGGAIVGTIGGIIVGYVLGFLMEILCIVACFFGYGDGGANGYVMVWLCGIVGCLIGGYTGWASEKEKSNAHKQQNMQHNQKINLQSQNINPTSDIIQPVQTIKNQSWQPTVTYDGSVIDDFLEGLDDNLYI